MSDYQRVAGNEDAETGDDVIERSTQRREPRAAAREHQTEHGVDDARDR